ncbi:hypothetical protein ACVIHI_004055 [Bradyrhizobium sp. USDA 4524]|uniref:hypothetical protein n=2 Tax=Nitrobacteraceae TaxID=41294 RepID=UPI0020A17DEC|nr:MULTISPECIES: hypothetical protein [unclassified Bradyrhizobium]MCP1843025.1 hypothetical protein [Bradyrhizobium sp. USDA 4538]MCP1903591.1 hypothetical protein [Bradyrhizobium sp. USDA 4537]MCP1990752.1 hypothetical protein [Bradyrhizobium sp. USDA 4539]
MYKEPIIDELRQIEFATVEGERRLAEKEAQLIECRRLNEDTSKIEAELAVMREVQLDRERLRQRLLSLLHPL